MPSSDFFRVTSTGAVIYSDVKSNKLFELKDNVPRSHKDVRYHKLKAYLQNVLTMTSTKPPMKNEHSSKRKNANGGVKDGTNPKKSRRTSGGPSPAQEPVPKNNDAAISEALKHYAPNLFQCIDHSRMKNIVGSVTRLEHSIRNVDNFVSCSGKRELFTILELTHHWSNLSKQLLDLFVSVEGTKYLDHYDKIRLMFNAVGPETRSKMIRQKHKKYHVYFNDICDSHQWIRYEQRIVAMIERAEKLPNHVEEGFSSLPGRVKLFVKGTKKERRELLANELAKQGLKLRPTFARRSFIDGLSTDSVHQVVAIGRVETVLRDHSKMLWKRRSEIERENLAKFVWDNGLTWSEACDKVIQLIKHSHEYTEPYSDAEPEFRKYYDCGTGTYTYRYFDEFGDEDVSSAVESNGLPSEPSDESDGELTFRRVWNMETGAMFYRWGRETEDGFFYD